jgi:hypothetical protein
MSKTLLSLLAAVLVCMAVTSAQADQAISQNTLDSMGLSGLTVMSDSDAMSIRGMGYHSKKSKKSLAKASGRSWAEIEFEGEKEDVEVEAETGSNNKYKAEGKYHASGKNGSEAELEKSWTTRFDYDDGDYMIETKTFKIEVEAGGFSSSRAF